MTPSGGRSEVFSSSGPLASSESESESESESDKESEDSLSLSEEEVAEEGGEEPVGVVLTVLLLIPANIAAVSISRRRFVVMELSEIGRSSSGCVRFMRGEV